MHVIPELKHNRHENVTIPKPAELFKVYGPVNTGKSFSGDEVVPQDSTKVQEALRVNSELDQQIAEMQTQTEK